ncbi:unnamed protein product [Amoebophrya sp. A25]|nr:unnamed protein product [Amoebophrya sp. A25]|eukprot:GSA25T00022214001.1
MQESRGPKINGIAVDGEASTSLNDYVASQSVVDPSTPGQKKME